MSMLLQANFRPRAACPGEVVTLVPDLWDPGQTLPVNVPKNQLLNFYIEMFCNPMSPFYQAPEVSSAPQDWRRSQQAIPSQW